MTGGDEDFLLEPSEPEMRRIKREARLLLVEFGLVGPEASSELSEPALAALTLPALPSTSDSPLASAGERVAEWLLYSDDDLRLLALRRRGNPPFGATAGPRDGDLEGDAMEGEARLSVDGDLTPRTESRRSLMKSLTMVMEDRRLNWAASVDCCSSLPASWSPSTSCFSDDLLLLETRRLRSDDLASKGFCSAEPVPSTVRGETERFRRSSRNGELLRSRPPCSADPAAFANGWLESRITRAGT